MFMAQCFRFGWRRCSPLNWALGSFSLSVNPVETNDVKALLFSATPCATILLCRVFFDHFDS
ncbi:hypothetical protein D8T33_22285 [Vibrio vulnificus]|nr:hypothetical protein D8T33_22285 [Vibrio vulnificus]